MPITATLSRKFYEKFGDEVTNELVTWLNAVDASYRQEFRELFAAHFGQLRAEMDTLRVQLRSEMNTLRVELRSEMETLGVELRSEMETMETRLRAHTDGRFKEVHTSLANLRADIKADQEAANRRMLHWVLGMWLITVPGLAAIFVALQNLGWL